MQALQPSVARLCALWLQEGETKNASQGWAMAGQGMKGQRARWISLWRVVNGVTSGNGQAGKQRAGSKRRDSTLVTTQQASLVSARPDPPPPGSKTSPELCSYIGGLLALALHAFASSASSKVIRESSASRSGIPLTFARSAGGR